MEKTGVLMVRKGKSRMKKCFALLMGVLLMFACACGHAEMPERTVASYVYELADGGEAYAENLIFHENVIVSGENAQMVFVNCEFNADIILTAQEATRVLLLGCDVNGTCIYQNNVTEATLEYVFPKFLTDKPLSAVCEGCSGTLIAMGDFEVTLNGQTYSMADCELFGDMTVAEPVYVPYDGQEASYYCIAHWQENGQPMQTIICELDSES